MICRAELETHVNMVEYNILHYMYRRLKLKTDGGYARVHELGSIGLFVVTSLKMNQLSPNFERKFPIMYGILTANFLHYDLPFI